MKSILLTLVLVFVNSPIWALEKSTNDLTVVRNGLTLKVTAKNYSEEYTLTPVDALAEVEFLMQKYDQYNIDNDVKAKLVTATFFSATRRYFRVQTKPENKNLVGITAFTRDNETFITPEYDNLPDVVSRTAVIYREALKALNYNLTEKQIYDLQSDFEIAVRCTDKCAKSLSDFYHRLYYSIAQNPRYLMFKLLSDDLKYDMAKNILNSDKGYPDSNSGVKFSTIFGLNNYNLAEAKIRKDPQFQIPNAHAEGRIEINTDEFRTQLAALMTATPDSLFFKSLYNLNDRFIFAWRCLDGSGSPAEQLSDLNYAFVNFGAGVIPQTEIYNYASDTEKDKTFAGLPMSVPQYSVTLKPLFRFNGKNKICLKWQGIFALEY